MKKFIFFALILIFCASAFSQENSNQHTNDENASQIKFSILNADLLKITPYLANIYKYREIKTMFHSVSSNEKIKRQKFLNSTAFAILETIIENSVPDAICDYANKTPQQNDSTDAVALLAGATSYAGALVANEIEKTKYFQKDDYCNLILPDAAE